MGYEFTTMTADIDEKGIRREKPEELVMVLAEAKADAILSKLKIMDYKDSDPTLLLTSDIVYCFRTPHYCFSCMLLWLLMVEFICR